MPTCVNRIHQDRLKYFWLQQCTMFFFLFQLAITAPRLDLIGYGTATEQSCWYSLTNWKCRRRRNVFEQNFLFVAHFVSGKPLCPALHNITMRVSSKKSFTLLVSAVLTLGMLLSNCTLLAALSCFFRSRYVRAATLLSISQARKWFPSLLCLKSKSPLISTWLSKESALPGVFVNFSGARGELPPPQYGCRRLLASPRGIKLSIRSCRSVSFHFTQTFLEKVLVVSNHAMLKSFVQRKKQSLPEVRLHVGSSIDRWIRKC